MTQTSRGAQIKEAVEKTVFFLVIVAPGYAILPAKTWWSILVFSAFSMVFGVFIADSFMTNTRWVRNSHRAMTVYTLAATLVLLGPPQALRLFDWEWRDMVWIILAFDAIGGIVFRMFRLFVPIEADYYNGPYSPGSPQD